MNMEYSLQHSKKFTSSFFPKNLLTHKVWSNFTLKFIVQYFANKQAKAITVRM